MPVEEMFAGPGRTSLAAGELLVAIRLPPAEPPLGGRPTCASRRGARWTSRWRAPGCGCGSARMAPSRRPASCWPRWRRRRSALRRPRGSWWASGRARALFEEAGRLAAKDARPISDTRGSADYRRTLVAVLTARALADCCRQLEVEGADPMKTLLELHRQRRGAGACSPTRATRCSICCATGSA